MTKDGIKDKEINGLPLWGVVDSNSESFRIHARFIAFVGDYVVLHDSTVLEAHDIFYRPVMVSRIAD